MKDGADTLYHGCYNALEGFSKCNINKFIHEKEEYLSQRAVFSHFRYSIAIMRYLVNKIAIIGIGFIDGLVQTSLIKFIKLNCIRIMQKNQKAYK